MIEPRAIGWQLPVTLGILVILDQLVALGALGIAPRSGTPLGPRVLTGLLTVAVVSSVLALARWTWLRTAFAQRHRSVGVLSVALAVQVGLVTSRRVLVAEGVLERQPGLAADEFVFLTATTIVVLLVLGPMRRQRELMDEIATVRSRLAAAHAASASGLAEERARLADRVRELLEQRLGPTSMRGALFTPDRLRQVADDVIRPLAHQLALTPSDVRISVPPGRRERLSTALRQLAPMPVLRPGLLAATMGLLVFRLSITPPPADLLDQAPGPVSPGDGGPDLVLTVEWASLVESLALHAATVLIVLLGTRRLARWIAAREQRPQGRRTTPQGGRAAHRATAAGPLVRAWAITAATLSGLGLIAFTLLRIVFGLPGFVDLPPVTFGVLVGFTAPLLLITLVLSVVPAAEDALADMRAQLMQGNDDLAGAVARANALLDHERRLFARHLHASVQAAVNAASLAIERATSDGTVDAEVVARAGASIDTAVERLRELPSTSEHGVAGGVAGAADLEARLTAIFTTWEDLADIDLRLDDVTRTRLAGDTIARATLCDLLAEACANAVIHGRATRITVDVVTDGTAEARTLTLRVADDGRASTAQRPNGLGSYILTTSCTAWDLEHRDDGTVLTATLPVR